MIETINLAQKFDLFNDYWSPKVIGDLNDSYLKLAKLQGEFVWHQHAHEDELFIVIKGRLVIKFSDHQLSVGEGELVVVPKGVDHCPVAAEEVHVLLIEPKVTQHTGDLQTDKTVAVADQARI